MPQQYLYSAQEHPGTDNRHPVTSFVVGVLIALLIVAEAFILLVSQR